ncbi:MAG: peptidyl-prolyl cis-trans isomerase [Synergistes sp.]|nr:peptidyl-prolyl cis-trans isomerase [Synergistes sp.]
MSIRKSVTIAIAIAIAAAFGTPVLADEKDEPVLSVGSESLTADDMLSILQESSGGNAMMLSFMLSQSTIADRLDMAKQLSDAILFSEAAKLKGIDKRKEVALKVKWQTINILLHEYMREVSAKWDMSPKAMKAYYNAHKDEFVQQPSQHIYNITTKTEKEAADALLEINKTGDFAKAAEKFSCDAESANKGGDLGWTEKGTIPDEIQQASEKLELNNASEPIKTQLGWHIIKVTERRPSKQLTFEEATEEVAPRLQMSYINKELDALRKKFPVTYNEKALENLGGMPAVKPGEQSEANPTDAADSDTAE